MRGEEVVQCGNDDDSPMLLQLHSNVIMTTYMLPNMPMSLRDKTRVVIFCVPSPPIDPNEPV